MGDAAPGGEQLAFGHPIFVERTLECVHSRRVAFIEQDAEISLGRQHEQLVGVHKRSPEVPNAVKSDSVRPCPLP